jgi:hypothetical protein
LASLESADSSAASGGVIDPAIWASFETLDAAAFSGATSALAGDLSGSETIDQAALAGELISQGAVAGLEAADAFSAFGNNGAGPPVAIIETFATGTASWSRVSGCGSSQRITT